MRKFKLPEVIVSDAVPQGTVLLASGLRWYDTKKEPGPRHVLGKGPDGFVYGFLDAAKAIDCGRRHD